MDRRFHRWIAFALFSTGLALFGVFHLLPWDLSEAPERGYQVWNEAFEVFTHWRTMLEDAVDLVAFTCFLMVSAGLIAAPFLVRSLSRSRLLWWIATLSWFVACTGLIFTILENTSVRHLGPAQIVLISALLFDLVGLFFIRREPRPAIADGPASQLHPDGAVLEAPRGRAE